MYWNSIVKSLFPNSKKVSPNLHFSKKKRHMIKRERAVIATKKCTEFRFIPIWNFVHKLNQFVRIFLCQEYSSLVPGFLRIFAKYNNNKICFLLIQDYLKAKKIGKHLFLDFVSFLRFNNFRIENTFVNQKALNRTFHTIFFT